MTPIYRSYQMVLLTIEIGLGILRWFAEVCLEGCLVLTVFLDARELSVLWEEVDMSLGNQILGYVCHMGPVLCLCVFSGMPAGSECRENRWGLSSTGT